MTDHHFDLHAPLLALIGACLMASACGASGSDSASTSTAGGGVAPAEATRIVVDEPGLGSEPGIVVINSTDELVTWWRDAGGEGSPPSFEPDRELMLAFTTSYPSGCEFPFLSVDIDVATRVIEARFGGNEPAECAADENPYSVIAAVGRTALPAGPWSATSSIGRATATFELP